MLRYYTALNPDNIPISRREYVPERFRNYSALVRTYALKKASRRGGSTVLPLSWVKYSVGYVLNNPRAPTHI